MIDYRTLRVWEWIAEYAGTRDAPLTVGTTCSACVSLTGMSGAWVSLGHRPPESVFATDPIADRLADLQVVAGEGPAVDACRAGRRVAVTDLSTAASRREWPMFTAAALDTGARSMLVVPTRVGGAGTGLFGLYSRMPTALPGSRRAEVGAFAEVIVGLVLDDLRQPAPDLYRWFPDGRSPFRPEIHQATGIVSAQLGVDVAESLLRLRAHAYAQARPLLEIAREVVTRRLRFSPDSPKAADQGP